MSLCFWESSPQVNPANKLRISRLADAGSLAARYTMRGRTKKRIPEGAQLCASTKKKEIELSQMNISSVIGQDPGESTDQGAFQIPPAGTAAITIRKVGWWSAMLTGICSIGYGIAVIALFVYTLSDPASTQSQGWTGIEDFLVTFQPIQMLPVLPSLLLAPAFTALMVSIHYYAPLDRKIWSHFGLAFTLIYASIAATNYMIQLLPVWRSINHGETDGLAMFVLGNPHSIFWGLAYAYIFMNLAIASGEAPMG
jgi:hypothetical protein